MPRFLVFWRLGLLVGVKEHDLSERKCWARDLFVGKSWSHEGHVMPVNSGILLLIGTFAKLREMYSSRGLSGAGTFAKIMRDVAFTNGLQQPRAGGYNNSRAGFDTKCLN